MNEDYFLDLIARKLANEPLDASERENLEQLMANDREYRNLFEKVEKRWRDGGPRLLVKNSETVYSNILDRLDTRETVTASDSGTNRDEFKSERKGKHILTGNLWWRAAAVILFFVVAGFFTKLVLNSPLTGGSTEKSLIVKSNPKGQKSLITLPDGSKVKLNSESTLEYGPDFSEVREVSITGEGFFDVKKEAGRPFVVRSGDVFVEVLGTSFNVEAYSGEKFSVAVETGRVSVAKIKDDKKEVLGTLTPNEQMKVDHLSGDYTVGPFDSDNVLAWKDGTLVFDHASIEEITKKIDRWYGVNMLVKNKVELIEGFSGRYEDEPLEVVLNGMSFACGFEYEIIGKNIIIW
jgi:ferric-dicitrate binding protein FerR (iron transport regulator)